MKRLSRALKADSLYLVLFLITAAVVIITFLNTRIGFFSEDMFIKWILVICFVALGYALQRKMNSKGTSDGSYSSTLVFPIPSQIGELYTPDKKIRFKLFNDFETLYEPFERVARINGTSVSFDHTNFLVEVEFDNKKCYNIILALLMVKKDDLEVYTSVVHHFDGSEHILVLHYREINFPFIVKINNEGVFIARRLC